MMPTNNELKEQALARLSGKWGDAVIAFLVVGVISAVVGIIPFASLVIAGPFALGLAGFFLRLARNEATDLKNVFDGFKNLGNAIGAYLLIALVVMLGLILLIVPGILAILLLSQTYRIMHDEPELGIIDSMKKSYELMRNRMGEYFLLNLSFIGWALLCILTLGLGFLVLIPYILTTNSLYYDHITNRSNLEIEELGSHLIEDVKE
ncbi:MAG: DUF975 family protein [Chitinophagaceae bacterium]